jgi:hypothetical protein
MTVPNTNASMLTINQLLVGCVNRNMISSIHTCCLLLAVTHASSEHIQATGAVTVR